MNNENTFVGDGEIEIAHGERVVPLEEEPKTSTSSILGELHNGEENPNAGSSDAGSEPITDFRGSGEGSQPIDSKVHKQNYPQGNGRPMEVLPMPPPTRGDVLKDRVEKVVSFLILASRLLGNPITIGSLSEMQRRQILDHKPKVVADYVDGSQFLNVYDLDTDIEKPMGNAFLNRLVFPVSNLVPGNLEVDFKHKPFKTGHIKFISPLGTEIVFDTLVGKNTDLQGNPFYHLKISGKDVAAYFDEETGELDMYPLDDIYNAVSAEKIELEGWDVPVTTINAEVEKLGLVDKPNPELHIIMTDPDGSPVDTFVINELEKIQKMTRNGILKILITGNKECADNLEKLGLNYVYSPNIKDDTSIVIAGSCVYGPVLKTDESGNLVITSLLSPEVNEIFFKGVGETILSVDKQFGVG